MQLSVLHIFINHNYNGVLKLEIVKKFHNLCISSSMYKINTIQNDTLEIFQNNLESDPSNPNIIDIIPTNFVYSEIFQLPICEKIVEYFNNVIRSNTNEYYRVNLGTNLVCSLNKIQMQRVYNFFNSFVMNFALLDSIYSIYLNILNVKGEGSSNIESNIEEKNIVKSEITTPVLTKPVEKEIVEENRTITRESNIYTQILDYCINNNIKMYVIHHIFTYLKDLAPIKIKKENNVNILQLNSLYPVSSILLNDEYLLSTLNTLLSKNINEELFNFNQKKIQESIYHYINNPQDSVLLLILIFIYYTHLYRTIILKYPDFDNSVYFSSTIQQSALNFFLKDLKFEISDCLDYEEQKEKSNMDSLITTLSENYKHLIPVSQEDFADIIINDINKDSNTITNDDSKLLDNIVLSTKKIIDINVLISNQEIINKSNTQHLSIVDTSNYVVKDNQSLLLNYQRNIITKTYNYFKNYIENPSSVLLIKDEPKEVINLFDFFSKSISKLFSNTEDISTLNYYKILYSNLPSANKYSFNTYLYLIYNLIIPYYVDVHKVNQFVDYFL